MRACGHTDYSTAYTRRSELLAQTLTRQGILVVSPHDWMCDGGFCPVIVGNMLVYRDNSHITATYSRWLAPLVEPILTATPT